MELIGVSSGLVWGFYWFWSCMAMSRKVTFLACLLSLASGVVVVADEVSLENQYVKRVLVGDGQVWRTRSFSRGDDSDRLSIKSDEFRIRMMDGTELTVADFEATEPPVVRAEEEIKVVELRLTALEKALSAGVKGVEIKYFLADEPYLRKQIKLTMTGNIPVDRLEVERFVVRQTCSRGGRGEPVFVDDSWFMGLEYPGNEALCANNSVQLAHFPGHPDRDEKNGFFTITSRVAVVGVGAKGDPIELAFSDYLETIRRKNRIMLHYNSWYDFRQDELTVDNMLKTFAGFKEKVLDPYGLKMDTFVPDDGWQNPESIWEPKKKLYPEGFGPLARKLEEQGTRLGLWIPFNGYNLNTEWGEKNGYEKSDQGRYYCLTGKKYNQALRKSLEKIITEGNINYFKHDFNHLRCSGKGHGHLPDDRHGHEENLDAELELLAFERTFNPDIYLNVTSYVWHSPWWLMHAESVWMNAGDFGYNTDWPQLSPREWAMSYRDAHFHKLYDEQKVLIPLSAMMTHGIIHGRYQKLGGDAETLREWSDYVVMYYGRGVQLMEWYITPEMMSTERWDILGRATQWAIHNKGILEQVTKIGGDPRTGQPYGYMHWLDDRGILVLRNPDVMSKRISVPFDKSVRYRGETGKSFKAYMIYPYVEAMTLELESGRPFEVDVPGCSVLVCELSPGKIKPGKQADIPTKPVAEAELVTDDERGSYVKALVEVPNEDFGRFELLVTVRNVSVGGLANEVTVDGQPVTARTAFGADWRMQSVDLSHNKGRKVEVKVFLDDGEQPFRSRDAAVDAYLLADREVAPFMALGRNIPVPVGQKLRRQTVELLKDGVLKSQFVGRQLRKSDIGKINKAKLRIKVFGRERYSAVSG